jgi:hypothetical protein
VIGPRLRGPASRAVRWGGEAFDPKCEIPCHHLQVGPNYIQFFLPKTRILSKSAYFIAFEDRSFLLSKFESQLSKMFYVRLLPLLAFYLCLAALAFSLTTLLVGVTGDYPRVPAMATVSSINGDAFNSSAIRNSQKWPYSDVEIV